MGLTVVVLDVLDYNALLHALLSFIESDIDQACLHKSDVKSTFPFYICFEDGWNGQGRARRYWVFAPSHMNHWAFDMLHLFTARAL